jgi:hypothetical protein
MAKSQKEADQPQSKAISSSLLRLHSICLTTFVKATWYLGFCGPTDLVDGGRTFNKLLTCIIIVLLPFTIS